MVEQRDRDERQAKFNELVKAMGLPNDYESIMDALDHRELSDSQKKVMNEVGNLKAPVRYVWVVQCQLPAFTCLQFVRELVQKAQEQREPQEPDHVSETSAESTDAPEESDQQPNGEHRALQKFILTNQLERVRMMNLRLDKCAYAFSRISMYFKTPCGRNGMTILPFSEPVKERSGTTAYSSSFMRAYVVVHIVMPQFLPSGGDDSQDQGGDALRPGYAQRLPLSSARKQFAESDSLSHVGFCTRVKSSHERRTC